MRTSKRIEDHAIQLADEASRISSALRHFGHRQKSIHTITRGVNALVGVGVVVLVAVPDLAALAGPATIRVAGGVAAAILILDTLLPVLFPNLGNHDSIFGYSRYLHRYKGIVEETIANEKYTDDIRHGRLLETIRLIQENISDATTTWPFVDQTPSSPPAHSPGNGREPTAQVGPAAVPAVLPPSGADVQALQQAARPLPSPQPAAPITPPSISSGKLTAPSSPPGT